MTLENLLTADPPAPEDCFDHGDDVHPTTLEHLELLYAASELLAKSTQPYGITADTYVTLALARGVLVCEGVAALKSNPLCASIRTNLLKHLADMEGAEVPPCLHFAAVQKMLISVDRERMHDVECVRYLANQHGLALVQACKAHGCSDVGEELATLLLDFCVDGVRDLVMAYPQWAMKMQLLQHPRRLTRYMLMIAQALATLQGVDRRDAASKLLEHTRRDDLYVSKDCQERLWRATRVLEAIQEEDNRAFSGSDSTRAMLQVEVSSDEESQQAQLDDALTQLGASMPASDGIKPTLTQTLANAAADAAAFSSPARAPTMGVVRLCAGPPRERVVTATKLQEALVRMSPGVLTLVLYDDEKDGYSCNSEDDSPHKGRSRKRNLASASPPSPSSVACEEEAALHSSAPSMVTPPRMRRQRSGAVGDAEDAFASDAATPAASQSV